MAILRTLPVLLTVLPSLHAQSEQVVSQSDGNFELRATVRAAVGRPVVLRFRAKSGLGYRLALTGPAAGTLDDPGRRTGDLVAPALSAANNFAFRLVADGPRIQLELNGKPAWEYLEKEAGLASTGAVILRRDSRDVSDLEFRALPPTPPSFAERYGPAIGENAPKISAIDQFGKHRDFASLRGPKGLWILFIRSADW